MSNRKNNLKEIYSGQPLESKSRQEYRPADGLSDFVVERLPDLLNQIRAGKADIEKLVTEAENLVSSQSLHINFLVEQGREKDLLTVRIEVLMLQAAIVKEGGKTGPILTRMVDKIAQVTSRPATLTYEDVVINNPENDIRTFTNGTVGEAEASFYNGHRYIEEKLEPVLDTMEAVLKKGDEASTTQIIEALKAATEGIRITIAYTGVITNKMSIEEFAGTIRGYLGSLEDRKLRGPSGAFTARVPLIEFLAMGETIPQIDVQYQQDNLQYYPLTHQSALVKALSEAEMGKSLRQLLIRRGSPEEGMMALKELSDAFHTFRDHHLNRAIKKHLTPVYEGKETGTGGELIDFMQRRMDRTHGLEDKQK